MLEVKNISKYFDKIKAVQNLSFEVNKGEILGLLGENGAGKTTTFRMILGLIKPNEGTINLDGNPIDYSQTDKIGFTTEERSLLPSLTVKEQMLFYGNLKSMDNNKIINTTKKYLKIFEMEEYLNVKIKELSKGNKQKIQFISSIINEPKLLILDEPFTGLDPINVKLMKDCIYELKEKGTIIIFSSHQMEYIEEFCEKIIILNKGKTIVNNTVENIKNEYKKQYIKVIGNIDIDKLKEINYIEKIEKTNKEYLIKIKEEDKIKDLYKELEKYNITKFEISMPTISQIFIDKIGGKNE